MLGRITTPEAFLGHQMGADQKIARWDKIVDYFYQLGQESDRIQVTNMGPSTEGNPFLLAVISSPENLANLEQIRQAHNRLADPRGLSEDEAHKLASRSKSVVLQSMSLHASEIGGTQMAPELAYDLLSSDSEEVREILDNVVFLMVPCFNPDGQIMVTDWYNRWLGTEYEGCNLPWLYHKYSGHDNNRDGFMLNLIESQYVGQLLYRDWKPHVYQDHHHMGSYGARLYVAPYREPIHPYADPLVWREVGWYGWHMAYKLEEEGKMGILNGAQFPAWGHMGFHRITLYHNIAGMLTESASAKLATPLYIHPGQLRGEEAKTFPEYAPQTNFPHPWPGGWWRLRDIVEQQKIASMALLELAARFRQTVVWNGYQKASRQTARGQEGGPAAYLIPPIQHDPLTKRKLLQVLLNQGIELREVEQPFTVMSKTYPAGTVVVSMEQPKMGLVKSLLGQTIFPDNYWTRSPDGTPMVYDTACDTVAEYMGVEVIPVDSAFTEEFSLIKALDSLNSDVHGTGDAYVWDCRINDSYLLVNRLLAAGVKVFRSSVPVTVAGVNLPSGAFLVKAASLVQVEPMARQLGVDLFALNPTNEELLHPVRPLRVGLYRSFGGGNADEGWTRLVFDNFAVPYQAISDADIKSGKLSELVDVLVLPSDRKARFTGEGMPTSDVPPEYQGGMGNEGLQAIAAFVQTGGRLVALNQACQPST